MLIIIFWSGFWRFCCVPALIWIETRACGVFVCSFHPDIDVVVDLLQAAGGLRAQTGAYYQGEREPRRGGRGGKRSWNIIAGHSCWWKAEQGESGGGGGGLCKVMDLGVYDTHYRSCRFSPNRYLISCLLVSCQLLRPISLFLLFFCCSFFVLSFLFFSCAALVLYMYYTVALWSRYFVSL